MWQSFIGSANTFDPMTAGASFLAQQQQNNWNSYQADHAMDRSQDFAREQMRFQERMSSSAHQREVADLIKAGLNPILSATGGPGASTPGGAAGSGQMARMENSGQAAITSGMEAMKFRENLEQIRKTNELLGSQKKAADAQAAKTQKEADILGPKSFLFDKVTEALSNGASTVKRMGQDALDSYGPSSVKISPKMQEVQQRQRDVYLKGRK